MSERSDDPRLGALVRELPALASIPAGVDIGIIGFPHDEGVRRNKGRPGAAQAPAHFRARYKAMGALANPEFGVDLRTLTIVDAGDVAGGASCVSRRGGLSASERFLSAMPCRFLS